MIVGVSADSMTAHGKFSTKFNLEFPLISDSEKQLIEFFEVWQMKMMYGKQSFGIARSTFIFDPDGKLVKKFSKVKAAEHAAEVLEWLRQQ